MDLTRRSTPVRRSYCSQPWREASSVVALLLVTAVAVRTSLVEVRRCIEQALAVLLRRAQPLAFDYLRAPLPLWPLPLKPLSWYA
jgi:hypothetical protein